MAVNDTKIKISLIDSATGGLRSITAQYERLNTAIASSSKGYNSISRSSTSATNSLNQQSQSLEKVDAMMQRVIYSATRYLLIYKGFQAIGGVWDKVVVGGYEYNKMLETNKVGMAGILTSMTQVNGKQLTWNQALSASSQIMKQLNSEALRTSATSEELVETFRGLLGPGIGAGMKIDEIVKFTTTGVNAVKALGLPKNQLLQELRGLVQGGIKPASSTLATALGLKDSDIKAAKASSEGLYKFLEKRLKGFELAVDTTANTMQGRLARIQEGVARAAGEGGKPIYDEVNKVVGEIADNLIVVEKTTTATGEAVKTWKINPTIVSNIDGITERVMKLYSDLKDIGSFIAPAVERIFMNIGRALDFMLDNVKLIAAGFSTWKVYSMLSDLGKVAAITDGSYQATTKLGKAYQGIKNNVYGVNQEMQIYANLSNKLLQNTQQQGISAGGSNGVAGLAKQYQQLGISAKQAAQMEYSVVSTLIARGEVAALNVKKLTDKYAELNQVLKLTQEYQAKAGSGIMGARNTVLGEQASQRNEYNSLANSKRSEDSVTRLTEKYKQLGMSAEQAGAIQARVQKLISYGNTERARAVIAQADEQAKVIQIETLQAKASNEAYKTMIANIREATSATSEMEATEARLLRAMRRLGNEGVDSVFLLTEELQKLGFSQKQAYEMALPYAKALKEGNSTAVSGLEERILKEAKLYQQTVQNLDVTKQLTVSAKEWASVDYSKLTLEQEKILAFDVETTLQNSKNATAVNQVKVARESLTEAVKLGLITEKQAHQVNIELNKQIATGYVDIAGKIGAVITAETQKGSLSAQSAALAVRNSKQEQLSLERILKLNNDMINQEQMKVLKFNAVNSLQKSGNSRLVASYEQLINRIESVISAMQKRGMVATDVINAEINLTKQLIGASGNLAREKIAETNVMLDNTDKRLQANAVAKKGITALAGLATSVGVAASAYSSLTGETDSWVASAGDFVMQAGFMVGALANIVTALKEVEMASVVTAAKLSGVVALGAAVAAGSIWVGKSIRRIQEPDFDFTKKNPNENLWESQYSDAIGINISPDGDKQEKDTSEGDRINAAYKEAVRKATEEAQKAVEEVSLNALGKHSFDDGESETAKVAKAVKDNSEKERREAEKRAAEAEALRKERAEFITGVAESLATEANGAGRIFGENGCTAFTDEVLANTEFRDLFSPESGGRWVPTAWEKAKALGAQEGTEGMRKGAVIFYADKDGRTGSHVGIYDGDGGVYHNSSSQGNKAYHQRGSIGMGDNSWVMGYLNTDGGQIAGMETSKKAAKVNKTLSTLRETVASLNSEIASNKGIYSYEENIANQLETVGTAAYKQITKVNGVISEANAKGLDTTYLSKKLDEYTSIMEEKMERTRRSATDNMYAELAETASRMVGLNKGTQDEQDKEYAIRLTRHQDYLNKILATEKLTTEERKKYEQELTTVITEQENLKNKNIEGAWENTVKQLKNYTAEYKSSFESVQTSISDGFTSLMDGVLTGQNAFADNIVSSWKNITNAVVNSIWKMAMQMLVVKPLFNWLGSFFGGGDSGKTINIGNTNLSGVSYSPLKGGQTISIGAKANGGLANGWTIVGEKGPELVNFSSPGRVYTAQQTSNALGGGGLQDVKVEIINNTNQDVKASDAQVSFDGKGYVVSVVMEAVAKNTNGIRSVLKGAVTSY